MRKKQSPHVSFRQTEKALPRMQTKEKKLPLLRLKYFRSDDAGTPSPYTDLDCGWCGKIGIVVGGGYDLDTNEPKVVCEDCAIDRYQKDLGFTTREAAVLRRRRIFDVQYLFQERVIDIYLSRAGVRFEEVDPHVHEALLDLGDTLYREGFSKKEKMYLEERVNQSVIERHIDARIQRLNVTFTDVPQVSPYLWV